MRAHFPFTLVSKQPWRLHLKRVSSEKKKKEKKEKLARLKNEAIEASSR